MQTGRKLLKPRYPGGHVIFLALALASGTSRVPALTGLTRTTCRPATTTPADRCLRCGKQFPATVRTSKVDQSSFDGLHIRLFLERSAGAGCCLDPCSSPMRLHIYSLLVHESQLQ